MVGDNDHFFCLGIEVAEHGVPISRLFVKVSGKALLGSWKTDLYYTFEVMYAFKIEVIDRHVVHASLQAFGNLVVVNAVDSQFLLARDGARAKSNAVVYHVDRCCLFVNFEGALFGGRSCRFRAHDTHLFNHIHRIAIAPCVILSCQSAMNSHVNL